MLLQGGVEQLVPHVPPGKKKKLQVYILTAMFPLQDKGIFSVGNEMWDWIAWKKRSDKPSSRKTTDPA